MNTTMKRSAIIPVLLLAVTLGSGCELVGDIFKAGFWSAIILIALVLFLVIFIINRVGRRRE
jgi:membrane protein YdbS with pleckstrin-like domain